MKPQSTSLGNRAIKGGIWSASGQLIARGADFVALVLLARMLGPADFGLVAIAMTVVLIIETILDLPVMSVLVSIREPTDAVINTAFTISLLRAILVWIAAVAAGLYLQLIYSDDRLAVLAAVLALAPALRGLMSPKLAIKALDLDFRPQFLIDITSKAAALSVAVTVAFVTGSYWAIVAGTVASPIIMLVMSYILAPHRLKLSMKHWGMFSNVIGWSTLTQILSAVSWQIDRLVLPRHINVLQFGRYVTASDISSLPIKVFATPLAIPMLAALSRAKEVSDERLRSAYLMVLEGLLVVMLPMLAVLAFFSEYLLTTLLGEKWSGAASTVTFLSIIGMLAIPRYTLAPFCMVFGKVRFAAILTFAELATKAPLLLILVPSMGIQGALISLASCAVIASLGTFLLVNRLAQIKVKTQLYVAARPCLALLGMSAVAIMLKALAGSDLDASGYGLISGLGIFACLIAYGLMIIFMWSIAGKPNGLVSILLTKVGRNPTQSS